MPKLLDLFRFATKRNPDKRQFFTRDSAVQRDDRAILADRYPPDGADIESVSEYRLASLMQYPHY